MTDVFASVHHPGDMPAALVYGRALVGPIGFCALPLMVGATAAALQQTNVLPFLTWGFPAALLVASLWTRFRLGAAPAEVRVRPHRIAVRSVHDCVRAAPPEWQRIHQVRQDTSALGVTAGFDTYRFVHADWPDYPALLDALRAARRAAAPERPPLSASVSIDERS